MTFILGWVRMVRGNRYLEAVVKSIPRELGPHLYAHTDEHATADSRLEEVEVRPRGESVVELDRLLHLKVFKLDEFVLGVALSVTEIVRGRF